MTPLTLNEKFAPALRY